VAVAVVAAPADLFAAVALAQTPKRPKWIACMSRNDKPDDRAPRRAGTAQSRNQPPCRNARTGRKFCKVTLDDPVVSRANVSSAPSFGRLLEERAPRPPNWQTVDLQVTSQPERNACEPIDLDAQSNAKPITLVPAGGFCLTTDGRAVTT
jgi:hypothetical protein